MDNELCVNEDKGCDWGRDSERCIKYSMNEKEWLGSQSTG